MLSVYVYEGNAPINSNLTHDLTIIETKYEGVFTVNSLRKKAQLLATLEKGEVIGILIFNELVSVEYVKDMMSCIREQLGNKSILFVLPLMYANSVAQILHKLGPITFVSECIKLNQLEGLLIQWEQRSDDLFFTYRNSRKFISAPYEDILYFEGEKRHIHLVTKYGKDEFVGKMDDLQKQICRRTRRFIRTHQSYIINASNISSILQRSVRMRNNSIVPISNNYSAAIDAMAVCLSSM